MFKAEASKQLLVTVDNRVGTLADVTQMISESGINLIALCASAVENKGIFMLVTENNARAKKIMAAQGYDVREEEVVLLAVDNKPGALQKLARKIADAAIDLTLIYGSVEKGGKTSRLVLVSENNKAVLMVLKLK